MMTVEPRLAIRSDNCSDELPTGYERFVSCLHVSPLHQTAGPGLLDAYPPKNVIAYCRIGFFMKIEY